MIDNTRQNALKRQESDLSNLESDIKSQRFNIDLRTSELSRLRDQKKEEHRLSSQPHSEAFSSLDRTSGGGVNSIQPQLVASQPPRQTATSSSLFDANYGTSTISVPKDTKGKQTDRVNESISTKGRPSTSQKVKNTSAYSCNLI